VGDGYERWSWKRDRVRSVSTEKFKHQRPLAVNHLWWLEATPSQERSETIGWLRWKQRTEPMKPMAGMKLGLQVLSPGFT
jgi:hypothetical protein